MALISRQNLLKITDELLKQGNRVISFSKSGIDFKSIASSGELIIESKLRPTNVSLKELVFPKSETLFYYKQTQSGIELEDVKESNSKTIIFGAKPCDAKSFSAMSKVFNWDYKDEFYNKKLENTIIIGLKCDYKDEYCFCESVGLSQSSKDGSDVFLTPVEDKFIIEALTEKGKSFLESYKSLLEESDIKAEQPEIKPEVDVQKIRSWLTGNFENPLWFKVSEGCLGCGKCAFICPTCHCFDIVDENYSFDAGRRMKNWDACQFGKFTLHASAHNPREIQAKRYRQRVSHKFKYYSDKFDVLLCTGCGRCSRECPVSINILTVLKEISAQ
jgi:ferredoxin